MDAALAAARTRGLCDEPESDGGLCHRAGRRGDRDRIPRVAGQARTRRSTRSALAGDRARGADVYVTLEPCAHQGRTPPCVDALIAAAPRRVVVAMIDPNPRVSGRGIDALRAAGIVVEVGVREAQKRDGSTSSTSSTSRTGLPFVTAKFAASLDGRIATAGGESQLDHVRGVPRHRPSPASRHDAVLVGINTVLLDDPALTTRFDGRTLAAARGPRQRRCVFPKVLASWTPEPDRCWWRPRNSPVRSGRRACARPVSTSRSSTEGRAASASRRCSRSSAPATSSASSSRAAPACWGRPSTRGSSTRWWRCWRRRIIGGVGAPGAVGGTGAPNLAAAPLLHDVSVETAGPDLVVTGYCVR